MLSLSSRPIKDLMSRNVVTVTRKTNLRDAAQIMRENKVESLIVVNRKKPVGILTERDYVKMIENGKNLNPKMLVEDIYVSKMITVTPSTRFSKAFSLLNKYGFKQLPVLQNGELKGLLTRHHILQFARNNLIEAIEENRVLERKVNYDMLTGTFSKRYLAHRMEEEFDRCQRYGIRTSVIFFDLDHFKKINDSFSHAVGDMVLKTVGKLIMSNARRMDIVARYGGEEFVMITPSTNSPEAAILANKIRATIQNHNFYHGSKKIKMTISAGVASFSVAKSVKQGLDRADKALYHAKNNGRNLVCRWSDSTGSIQIISGSST